MNISEVGTQLYTAGISEKKKSATHSALIRLLALSSMVSGFGIFALSAFEQDGVFFSRIDYSGNGFLGWTGLLITSLMTGGICSILALRLLRCTARRKPSWKSFTLAILALLLFLSGIARHSPLPMISEMLLSAIAFATLLRSFYKNPEIFTQT